MDRRDYTAANRQSWNEAAPVHKEQKFEELLQAFRSPGYSRLDQIAVQAIEKIDIQGKAVAQLCCNNGRELLSVKNMGAGRCVGFDIADNFIEQGRQLAAAGNIPCEFIQTDIYEIPQSYNHSFDLVIITIGALGWLPDLPLFFQVVARLLAPQGHLFIYEMHPILDMFEGDDPNDPPHLHHSYFRTEPYIDDQGHDYYGGSTYASSPAYWFHHKLSDIIGGILAQSLALVDFQEYGHDISNVFANFEKLAIKPPLCYTLVARVSGN